MLVCQIQLGRQKYILMLAWRKHRLSIQRMWPGQFRPRSLARSRTSTVRIPASPAISLPVIFDSILEPAESNSLPPFSLNFHDSYMGVDTTDEREGGENF